MSEEIVAPFYLSIAEATPTKKCGVLRSMAVSDWFPIRRILPVETQAMKMVESAVQMAD